MSAYLNTPDGQFAAILFLYMVTVGLRVAGYGWAEQDHALVIGALLTLLKSKAEAPKS